MRSESFVYEPKLVHRVSLVYVAKMLSWHDDCSHPNTVGVSRFKTWRKWKIKLSSLHQSPLNLCPPPLQLYFSAGANTQGRPEGRCGSLGNLKYCFHGMLGEIACSLDLWVCFWAGSPDFSLPTKEYVTSYLSLLDTSPSYPTSREGGNVGRIQRQICGVDAVRMMGSKRSKEER